MVLYKHDDVSYTVNDPLNALGTYLKTKVIREAINRPSVLIKNNKSKKNKKYQAFKFFTHECPFEIPSKIDHNNP